MLKINSFRKVLIGGILLGLFIHTFLSITAYYNLKSKIKQSNFASIVFKDDPSIGVLFSLGQNSEVLLSERNLDAKLVWRLLVDLNVLDWNSTEADISSKLKKTLESQISARSIVKTTTIRHLIEVAQRIGSKSGKPEYSDDLQNLIAACLANGPNAFTSYVRLVGSKSPYFSYSENPIAFLLPRQLNPWLWGDKCSQEEIVNMIFIHTDIASDFDNLPDAGNIKSESVEPSMIYHQVNEYFQRVFISIHDDSEVIAANNWFTIVEGPEQFFMYIVFSMGIFVLIMHYQHIKKLFALPVKQERFTIIFYRWIQIALPSLGFIGTKRGLSAALGRADSIVRAGSQINQSIAVSNVSETMGIAFTSTLVGLILLMILMIVELCLKYQNLEWNE